MKMNILLLLTLIVVIVFFTEANASSVTAVIDILEKTYGVDIDQLEEIEDLESLQNDLKQLSQEQIDGLSSILSTEQGHYTFGGLLNQSDDLTERTWSADTWSDALKGLSGGNPDRYKELVEQYNKDHPAITESQMSAGSSTDYTKNYLDAVAVNQAANVQASYEFNDINTHLENIKTLSDEIENAENEKSISDLNARINTESAYLMVEEIKMLSLLNQQYAQSEASNLVDRVQVSKFNNIPEE